jgi:hypothetical protein
MAFLVAIVFMSAPEPGWSPPPVTLWPAYQGRLEAPCEHLGFSFDEGETEMREQRASGATIAGSNQMWIPAPDPDGPHGLRMAYRSRMIDEVRQPFEAPDGLRRVWTQIPTGFKRASFTLSVERRDGETRVPVASHAFNEVPDLFEAALEVPDAPPGSYELVITKVSGSTGVWLAASADTGGSPVLVDGTPRDGSTLEIRWMDGNGREAAYDSGGRHEAVWLSFPNAVDGMAREGLDSMVWVGNWNNGGFPYYPTWFYERFPDVTMLDARGEKIAAGMFGELKGWPSVTHPVIVEGTRTFIDTYVKAHRDRDSLVYWALGGECLYPPMDRETFGWPDYGTNAVAHFRAWLARRYDTPTDLSTAWGMKVASWEEAEAPRTADNRQQLFDWLDYRIEAMASRFSWHSAAVRAADPDRLRAACTHGNLFQGTHFIDLASDLSLYADTCDGLELGQIMEAFDPDYYNLGYASAMAGLGKPAMAARLAYRWPDPNARGGATSFTPEAARRYGIEAFGAGWWHLGYIQWSGDLPDGEWGVRGTPGHAAISEVFADMKRLRPLAEGSWTLLPRVALFPSYRQWVLDGWDPAWTEFHRRGIQSHHNPAILWERQLLIGEAVQHDSIVSIDNHDLSPGAITALAEHARRGGGLVLAGDHPDALISSVQGLERVRVIPAGNWDALEAALDSLEVHPFVRVESGRMLRRERETDVGAGTYETAVSLHPLRTLGQPFTAPADRLTSVAFNCATYTKKPAGFDTVVRVRRGGPEGPVLDEATVPAAHFADNAWTSVDLDIDCEPGETLFAEITPLSDIPEITLAVWAQKHREGRGMADGAPAGCDFRVRVGFEEELPAERLVEAFVLFDGWEYLVPLFSLADDSLSLDVSLDPALLEPGSEWEMSDALTGELLDGKSIGIEPWHYRVIRFARKTSKDTVDAALWRVTHREGGAGNDSPGAALLGRAQAALEEGRLAKAAAHLARIEASPEVELVRCELDQDGSLRVTMRVGSPRGGPFEGGSGVARAVPLPGVAGVFTEREPGLYETVIPARDLEVYDYTAREYRTYDGPIEVIANVWRGRTLAQATRRLR